MAKQALSTLDLSDISGGSVSFTWNGDAGTGTFTIQGSGKTYTLNSRSGMLSVANSIGYDPLDPASDAALVEALLAQGIIS